MTKATFKNTFFISLASHITVFSIFSLSFGNIIHKADYTAVCFLGELLWNQRGQAQGHYSGAQAASRQMFPVASLVLPVLNAGLKNDWQEKPPVGLPFNTEKESYVEKTLPLSSKTRIPTIIFHPLLPYSFPLYFKDRQVAHVELMFKVDSAGLRNSTEIKRKISSGNLEVDLLTMRYIGHYLFIQKNNFAPNQWQTVNIDLAQADD